MKNNELKFRAWDKTKKEWLNPKYFAIAGNGLLIRFDQYPDDKNSPDDWSKVYGAEQFIIQRFTGIKDNSGIEIYEGDIVEYEDWDNGWGHDNDPIEKGKGVVQWGHMAYGHYTHGWYIDEYKTCYSKGLEQKVMKVVGNKIEARIK